MSFILRPVLRGGCPKPTALLRSPIKNRSPPSLFLHSHAAQAVATPSPVPEFLNDEPAEPHIVTQVIPGPRSARGIAALDKFWDTRSVNIMCDPENSVGNYMSDADGNRYLDVYAQISSISVGYNNPRLMFAATSPEMASAIINRTAMGHFPIHNWANILQKGLLSVAPNGCDQVFTGLAGTDANELAFKASFMYYRRMQRGEDVDFSPEELASCMDNQSPGSPQLSILSFRKGFHGRQLGTLSTTRSKPLHKVDIPAFDWPQAPFPMLKYPLEEHVQENRAEEDRCLAEFERTIKGWKNPIAACIVEPIQGEGGDNHATPYFFQGVRKITKQHNVLLIVDEVQTGVGATGKFWAHDHWNLDTPPDLVTFAKKAQTGGYYFGNPLLRPNKAYRQYNTWMGDAARAILFREIVAEIKEHDLVDYTAQTGEYLYSQLSQLAKKYPHEIQNLRGKGQGTFLSWDSPCRDEFLMKMKYAGVNIGGCGDNTVRLRPMLIFGKRHTDIFVEAIDRVLAGKVKLPAGRL